MDSGKKRTESGSGIVGNIRNGEISRNLELG